MLIHKLKNAAIRTTKHKTDIKDQSHETRIRKRSDHLSL